MDHRFASDDRVCRIRSGRASGEANLALTGRYCALESPRRMVSVEGEETGEFTFPSSGGFSSSASDWVHAPSRGEDREPVLLELPAGERTVRMTNVDDNGVYMDYLLFCAASTKPSVKPM